MHVTARLAGQEVDIEVGEACRSLRALKEAIVEALPQLCVEGFDVSVGGRALDDDEGAVSLEESVHLDVVANARGLSVVALREAGYEVSEAGLLAATDGSGVALCTLYLDAGVPVDCVDAGGNTPLHLSCMYGFPDIATLLLDRGSNAIDAKNGLGDTPLHLACLGGYPSIMMLLLDRGSTAIDEEDNDGNTPLQYLRTKGLATLFYDRGSNVIEKNERGKIFQVLSATKELAIDAAAVLSVLLIVATLYRFPVLFASMQKRLPYGESWRKIAVDSVLEIPVDLLYCAKVLLIFLPFDRSRRSWSPSRNR